MSKPREKIIDDVNLFRSLVNDCLFASEDGKHDEADALLTKIQTLASSIPCSLKTALTASRHSYQITSMTTQPNKIERGMV